MTDENSPFALSDANTASSDAPALEETFTHRFETFNGINLHYVIGGQGNPLLLLHGYPETWYSWRKVMPLLANRYTVIVPDMRGLGDSSRPVDGDYTKKSVADDLYQLMQGLGYEQFYLAAQDMGGPVAVALAAAHPAAVRKMVLIETGVPGYGMESVMDTAHGGSWHFGLFADVEMALLLTAGREQEFFTAWAFRGNFVLDKATFTDADIAEYVQRYTMPGGMGAGFGYYKALAQDAKDNALWFAQTKLTLPILAVGADKSFGDFTMKNAQNVGVNVRGETVSNCGHFVNEEKPLDLSQLMREFFAES